MSRRRKKRSKGEIFAARLSLGFGMLHESHPDEPIVDDFDGPVEDLFDLLPIIDSEAIRDSDRD
jgi:hypothetical protein